MLMAALRDLQWRRRRFAIAVVGTGPLFGLPRSATARAHTDATVVGYTVQAFRERLGPTGVRNLIEHRSLDDEDDE
jgi:CRP-like cAMP-binding protein